MKQKSIEDNIVLIGFMGTGKTTVAQRLSELYGFEVLEMDQVIEEGEHLSIPEIFATYGEEYFRDLETNLLVGLQRKNHMVISCGGGAALREKNVAEMKRNGKIILLTASPRTVWERLKDREDRPLLNGHKTIKDIEELMEARRSKYEAAADMTISTDKKTVLAVCEELMEKLKGLEEK